MCMQKVRPPTVWPQQRTWNTSKVGRFVFESTIDRHMCPTTKPNRLFPALQFSRCSFHINKLSIQVTCDNGGILRGAAGHNAAWHRANAQRWPELAVFADIRRDPRQNSCSSIVAGRPLFDVRFTVTVWPAPVLNSEQCFILTFICQKFNKGTKLKNSSVGMRPSLPWQTVCMNKKLFLLLDFGPE